jgi:hypothetical protein
MQQNTFEGEAILSKVPQTFLAAMFILETIFFNIFITLNNTCGYCH